MENRTIFQRFFDKVEITDSCWEWQASTLKKRQELKESVK